ncbi:MAG: heavy metal translocating P-type ATPase [Clostridia bacterium]|nr:heavy metal translocating P-type ATPase [Clostridia bacterium]
MKFTKDLTGDQKRTLIRILIAACALIALHFIPVSGWPRILLYAAAYALIGYDIVWEAVHGILHGEVLDECFLMTAATLGAFVLAVYDGSFDGTEAVAVMLFYQIGELFQDVAVERSRSSITELMDIRPDTAVLETDSGTTTVDAASVAVGSVILVSPGERIPLDGYVLEGESSLDTSALTGESRPRRVSAGSEVLSGCVNQTGLLRILTTKAFGESTASRVLDLIENASARKSGSEAFISRFARIYTPVVCACALALALLPPLAGLLIPGVTADFPMWIYRALTFLVISCPCALVVSIPLTFFACLGGAGHAGILIKGSNLLEALSKADTVLFDKTGTLTRGRFTVTGFIDPSVDTNELLELAAHAECASLHPIAAALREAYVGDIDRTRVSDVREIGGYGVTAVVDGKSVAVGSERLLSSVGTAVPKTSGADDEDDKGHTVVHIAVNGFYSGSVVISDGVKDNARSAVEGLRENGVRRIMMLTGDNASAAKQTAGALGITEYRSELLPEDKVNETESAMADPARRGSVIFVGDGINDAPVLTRADVGIAMGALGTDAAIEAADVVLMDDDPLKVVQAIRLSRRCMRIVYENIVFSIFVKAACLLLSAVGVADMGAAVFADVGVMVICVLNAARALRVPAVKNA